MKQTFYSQLYMFFKSAIYVVELDIIRNYPKSWLKFCTVPETSKKDFFFLLLISVKVMLYLNPLWLFLLLSANFFVRIKTASHGVDN